MVRSKYSTTFVLFHQAILDRRPISCVYQGLPREICPHVLGHKNGKEMALVYQFGGRSSRGPVMGQWKCFNLAEVKDAKPRDGRWHTGEGHRTSQSCVDDVYVDVNTDVPDQPGRW